ncbi:MAG: hypothetical protein ACREXS_08300 [Gammaproteobacteria bacterium]
MPQGSEEAERCVGKRALQILNGKSSDVAAGTRRSEILHHLSADERKPVDICADYLLRYRDMRYYNDYLAPGLDITGARWRLTSAEALFKLRSLHSSGDSEAYWDLHKPQELKRSHSSPIKNCPLLEAA